MVFMVLSLPLSWLSWLSWLLLLLLVVVVVVWWWSGWWWCFLNIFFEKLKCFLFFRGSYGHELVGLLGICLNIYIYIYIYIYVFEVWSAENQRYVNQKISSFSSTKRMCGAFARHERVSIIANRHGDGGILTVKRITLHYTTLHYTTLITTHHNYNCNCNYTTLITLHYNYNSTTLQLQLHLYYTTPHCIQQLWVR